MALAALSHQHSPPTKLRAGRHPAPTHAQTWIQVMLCWTPWEVEDCLLGVMERPPVRKVKAGPTLNSFPALALGTNFCVLSLGSSIIFSLNLVWGRRKFFTVIHLLFLAET